MSYHSCMESHIFEAWPVLEPFMLKTCFSYPLISESCMLESAHGHAKHINTGRYTPFLCDTKWNFEGGISCVFPLFLVAYVLHVAFTPNTLEITFILPHIIGNIGNISIFSPGNEEEQNSFYLKPHAVLHVYDDVSWKQDPVWLLICHWIHTPTLITMLLGGWSYMPTPPLLASIALHT